tara:strand:+ start:105852 stop:107084 length:1233 start_codon:yes stop_codon:yes gene_type:complete
MSLPKNKDPIKTSLPESATVPDSAAMPTRDRVATTDRDGTTPSPPMSQCALLTGVGRSAVAVIGARGPAAAAAIEQGFRRRTRSPICDGEIRFGDWDGEAVVVTRIDAGMFEIHCHGGRLAASRILDDLRDFGVNRVDQSDWIDADLSLIIREAHQVLPRCLTTRTAAIVLDQVRGALQRWAQRQIDQLQGDNDGKALALADVRDQIHVIADRGHWGKRITEPFRVVLVGPPNVGKSSLVNAIVGYDRSITMDIAGTTRDVLHADTVIEGLPIRLSDTAGMRDHADSIEQQGIEFAKQAMTGADVLVVVSDPQTANRIDVDPQHSIQVLNKADLLVSQAMIPDDSLGTVATTGQGVPELMAAIAAKISADFPAPGAPVPLTTRQQDCLNRAATAADHHEAIKHLTHLIDQ